VTKSIDDSEKEQNLNAEKLMMVIVSQEISPNIDMAMRIFQSLSECLNIEECQIIARGLCGPVQINCGVTLGAGGNREGCHDGLNEDNHD